jgi:hypothetical protein
MDGVAEWVVSYRHRRTTCVDAGGEEFVGPDRQRQLRDSPHGCTKRRDGASKADQLGALQRAEWPAPALPTLNGAVVDNQFLSQLDLS